MPCEELHTVSPISKLDQLSDRFAASDGHRFLVRHGLGVLDSEQNLDPGRNTDLGGCWVWLFNVPFAMAATLPPSHV